MDMVFFLQDSPAAPQGSGSMVSMVVPLVLIFVVMYFLMIRPQRKQAKTREAMIANLKKNDHVFTSSGIYGIVKQVQMEENDLTLCIDERNDVSIRVTKASIAGLVKTSGAPENAPKVEAPEKK
jgi:preprotein translocase subunit YajC